MRTKGEILVDDRHFEFLKIQKGSLDKYTKHRAIWHTAYEDDIARQFRNIAPALPTRCWGFLDVGSGLGGIDILIRRHYVAQGLDPIVHLLDGVDDEPKMNLHRETFNNMAVAQDFHRINGTPPEKFAWFSPQAHRFALAFDLVVSFGSWCFHFPPDLYLPALVAGGMHPGTVVILDVRTGKPEWMKQLLEVFEVRRVLLEKRKFQRFEFAVRKG